MIALIFSGRIKSFEKCYSQFKKNILEPLKNHEIHSFLSHNSKNELSNIDDFKEKYNVKAFENCELDLAPYKSVLPLHRFFTSSYGTLYLHYHKLRAFNLMTTYAKEKNIKYDFIIHLRADVFYESPLAVHGNFDDNTLYIPSQNDNAGLNDQFALGNYKSMKYYCSLFNHIMNLCANTKVGYHSETYNLFYLLKCNIVRFTLKTSLSPDRYDKINTITNVANDKVSVNIKSPLQQPFVNGK
uniref:DUF7796 domain-containing protein n=1 Tax=viral metagenome TaxID=1070528 RepID=A0A6C0JSU7_9ZZZZ